MSDDHSASQRRLLRRASERAVELTKKLNIWPPSRKLKVQGVVAEAWLEGYVQAVDDLKVQMKGKVPGDTL